MERNRLIPLIIILCYMGMYKHSVFCAKPNKLQSTYSIIFKNPHEGDQKETAYKVRSARGPTEADLTDNLDKQKRILRGVAGSRHHLRVGDAHQVANYFLTGGPLKGHDHFTNGKDCQSEDTPDSIVGESNPTSAKRTDPVASGSDANTNSDSIVGAPLIPALPGVPKIPELNTLLGAPHAFIQSATSNLQSALHPVLNTLSGAQLSPLEQLVGAPLHEILPEHINTLHNLHSAFLKAAVSPLTSLMEARKQFQKTVQRSKTKKSQNGLIGNFVGENTPTLEKPTLNSNGFAPQPIGYIVRYVPHIEHTLATSPVVGSPHEVSSDRTNRDTNTKLDTVSTTQSGNANNTSETTENSQNGNNDM